MQDQNALEFDIQIGDRLKDLRVFNGFSQEKLGQQLGISFQQIQKYEKGKNRISSSTLFRISQIFSVPVIYFFDGLDSQRHSKSDIQLTPQIVQLIQDYESLPQERKSGLLNLLQLMKET